MLIFPEGRKEMISLIKGLKSNCSNAHGAEAEHPFANHNKSGLTLVELIVVMVLSLVLVGSAFMAYLAHSKTGREQHEIASLQQDIRAVMDMIDRDVRNSGCSEPRLATVSAIEAANSGLHSLGLNMDMNLNGTLTTTGGVPEIGERVTYSLSGATLQRRDQNVTSDLLNNVTTFGIAYFDLNNIAIVPAGTLTQTQANSVLSVQITLGLQGANINPDTGQTVKRSVRKRIQSRNQEILLKGM